MRYCLLLHHPLVYLLAAPSSGRAQAFFSAAPVTAIRSSSSSTILFSSLPPRPKRQARRDLKKRSRSKRNGYTVSAPAADSLNEDALWETGEVRPLISRNAVEMGLDYWMDPDEYKRAVEREEALKRNSPGQIPKEKLWTEVLSPYRQNWIGFISITIIVLTFIIQKFPELTDYPLIPLPDL